MPYINTSKSVGYYSGPKIDETDIEVPARPSPDYVWSGTAWIRGVAATVRAIDEKCGAEMAKGFTFGGHTYQIAEAPKNYYGNWVATLVALERSATNPTGGTVVDVDNNIVTITDADLETLCVGCLGRFVAILNTMRAHKNAVLALTDEQAAIYDLSTGWPE